MREREPYQETELLYNLSQGDENALRALLDKYSPYLSPFIYNFTKSSERTEEIVQDIFMQVWLARDTMNEIKNFKGFLYVLAKNHALNAVRSMIRDQKRLERYGNMMPKYQEAEPEPAPAMQWIEEAIGQLPAQQKKVWLLSRREGKKYAEIAEEMNISRETVKSYLKLANTSIMQQLQQKITVLLAGIGIFEEFLK